MSAVQALLLALGLSVAGNAALGWAWIGAREKAATSVLQRDDARAAASACSDATEDLRDLADKRAAEAKKAQAAARSVALGHEARAQTILATPAAVPGDACASAQARIDGWLKGRAGQ
ncbi:hypothetical protein [Variovorax atrisoli]|uniref:hypothetical protein n=1 Tax=Variovorax atrisoli TaxID=3394203 RepID=UPI0011A7F011|nr:MULTISPECIES: hypothetical protein [Variovorax]MBB3641182.1 hypothetical protein [Variovorax sp. BK613]MDR6522773.1 hypothetical protein [Variovorax paradoxus]